MVKGFSEMERRLLEGTVKLSQRRSPRLDLLGDDAAASADVVMVDARDANAMQWARGQPWLEHTAVIWVDAVTAPRRHTMARRPVQWPILPMLLARALEQGPRKKTDAARATIPADLEPSAASARGASNRPVLVVDDSLAVRAHLRSLLEARGVSVVLADSAETGIAAAAAAPYGCILMDVLMPGIDGYEACRRIKSAASAGKRPAIVMLTSKSSPFDRIRGKMAGCDAYLTKPVDPPKLHEVVTQYIAAVASTPM